MTQKGKVAIVTGAAQGIGVEYAKGLSSMGMRVAVADINLEKAQAVADEIINAGGEAIAVAVDVSSKESTLEMAKIVMETFGAPVEVLINNAAIYHSMRMDPMSKVDIEYWRKVFSVNLDGALLCIQAVAPQMIEAGWGRIINQTSSSAYLGSGGHYGCSKMALIGLTQGFAKEFGPHGITVNAIAPGTIFTEATEVTVPEIIKENVVKMQAIPRKGQPEDLVGMVKFLCSDEASWITAQTHLVDGGTAKRL
ncbi:SDR family oxidoreductase [Neobacillus niacini]|uniref:SDR family oxidoreductase n=1 Tax=Neobacillus niacini TaxID=86668 RepID=UPI002FFD6F56